jgi:hypothetical protein
VRISILESNRERSGTPISPTRKRLKVSFFLKRKGIYLLNQNVMAKNNREKDIFPKNI